MSDLYTCMMDICKQMSSLTCNIKEYRGVIMIKRVFISQPFSGRTEVEVMKEKEEIIKWLKILGIDAAVLDQYHQSEPPIDDPEKKRIWFLANSIQMMSMVDLVVFSDNWESAKGCRIEHEIAIEYNLPYIELPTTWRETIEIHKNENPGKYIGNFESLSIERGMDSSWSDDLPNKGKNKLSGKRTKISHRGKHKKDLNKENKFKKEFVELTCNDILINEIVSFCKSNGYNGYQSILNNNSLIQEAKLMKLIRVYSNIIRYKDFPLYITLRRWYNRNFIDRHTR